MKIVLDTNVLLSALVTPGKARELLFEIIQRKHQLLLSREILEEFSQISGESKMRKYVSREDVIRFLQDLASVSKVIEIRSNFRIVKEDPPDDAILRTCFDGRGSYIVSGDRHLINLKRFRRIRIISVDEMLRKLRER